MDKTMRFRALDAVEKHPEKDIDRVAFLLFNIWQRPDFEAMVNELVLHRLINRIRDVHNRYFLSITDAGHAELERLEKE